MAKKLAKVWYEVVCHRGIHGYYDDKRQLHIVNIRRPNTKEQKVSGCPMCK